jgi:hypothetical protein
MKRKAILLLFNFFLFFISGSCNSGKVITTDIIGIHFGNGGGFTGIVEEFVLTNDGKLFKGLVFITQIDLNTKNRLFLQAENLKGISLNNPGNAYSFIEIKSKAKSNRIIWSGQSNPDKSVTEFYNDLHSITK